MTKEDVNILYFHYLFLTNNEKICLESTIIKLFIYMKIFMLPNIFNLAYTLFSVIHFSQ
jgi:hypothetical protein